MPPKQPLFIDTLMGSAKEAGRQFQGVKDSYANPQYTPGFKNFMNFSNAVGNITAAPGTELLNPGLQKLGVPGNIAIAAGIAGDFLAPTPGGKAKSTPKVFKGFTDLTTNILNDLKGKSTVSKQYILDASNRSNLKQPERDLTRRLLQSETGTVDVSSFAKKMKSELLPLTTKQPKGIHNYEKDVSRYLKNKYQAKPVTDAQGVQWMEIDLKGKGLDKAPVEAFAAVPLFIDMNGDGQEESVDPGTALGTAAAAYGGIRMFKSLSGYGKIERSVVQAINPKTNKKIFMTIPKGQLSSFHDVIDSARGNAGKVSKDGYIYHLTAKSPEQMKTRGFKNQGTAKLRNIPTK